jgi:transcription antitermination factor NusA-like protein
MAKASITSISKQKCHRTVLKVTQDQYNLALEKEGQQLLNIVALTWEVTEITKLLKTNQD